VKALLPETWRRKMWCVAVLALSSILLKRSSKPANATTSESSANFVVGNPSQSNPVTESHSLGRVSIFF